MADWKAWVVVSALPVLLGAVIGFAISFKGVLL
jgi:hypothetical protein